MPPTPRNARGLGQNPNICSGGGKSGASRNAPHGRTNLDAPELKTSLKMFQYILKILCWMFHRIYKVSRYKDKDKLSKNGADVQLDTIRNIRQISQRNSEYMNILNSN